MFCPRCGAQVSPEAKFCPSCGNTQNVESPTGATPPPVAPVAQVPYIPSQTGKAEIGRWIGEGWDLVKADLGGFAVLALILLLINSFVPLILQGPLMVGAHIFCIKKLRYGRAELGDLFKGFDYFLPALLAAIVMGLFVFAGTLLCIIPGLVVAAAFQFGYLFVLDKRLDFWPALQSSHNVVKNDYLGFTLFIVVLALINVCGFLACLVGVLVTMPITIAATTVAYRDLVGFEPGTASN